MSNRVDLGVGVFDWGILGTCTSETETHSRIPLHRRSKSDNAIVLAGDRVGGPTWPDPDS